MLGWTVRSCLLEIRERDELNRLVNNQIKWHIYILFKSVWTIIDWLYIDWNKVVTKDDFQDQIIIFSVIL